MAIDRNGLAVPDPYADGGIRLPRPVRTIACWIPFAVNVLAVVTYVVIVVVPWLGYSLGPCDLDAGCEGPAAIQTPHVFDAVLMPVAVLLGLVVIGAPVVAWLLGGFTVLVSGLRLRKGRTVRRIATLVAGTLVLALAVFQMTPLGTMFDVWFID
jgi:hypothetical protein